VFHHEYPLKEVLKAAYGFASTNRLVGPKCTEKAEYGNHGSITDQRGNVILQS
jgi:hypothetical protein